MRLMMRMKILLMLRLMVNDDDDDDDDKMFSDRERGMRSDERVCVQSDKQCKLQRRSKQKAKGFVIDL
jgi:hypothetical protein